MNRLVNNRSPQPSQDRGMIELRSIEKLEDMILLDEQIFEQKMAIRQYIEAFRDTETSPSARHIFWQMASGKALNKGVLKLHATISAALPQLQDLTERSRVCGELQTCTAAIKYALMVAPTDGHWQRSAKKCGITNLPTVEYRNTLGTNRFNYPHDVAVAGSTIFVSDESKCLKMLSLDGKSLGLVSGINSPSGLYKTNLGDRKSVV